MYQDIFSDLTEVKQATLLFHGEHMLSASDDMGTP